MQGPKRQGSNWMQRKCRLQVSQQCAGSVSRGRRWIGIMERACRFISHLLSHLVLLISHLLLVPSSQHCQSATLVRNRSHCPLQSNAVRPFRAPGESGCSACNAEHNCSCESMRNIPMRPSRCGNNCRIRWNTSLPPARYQQNNHRDA